MAKTSHANSETTAVPVKIPPRTTSINPAQIELLLFAALILGHGRRLENLATWRDVLQRNSAAKAAGEHLDMTALLRHIQASRFAGTETDAGFFIVCQMAECHAETIFETDPELKELSDQIRAIKKREGLSEFDEFIPDHSETPADWKAANDQWNDRYQEVEKIRDDRFIGWLRRHGETEMAELFANDRAAFDRRREAGRCKIYGPMPDIITAAMQGDTGVTEVMSQNE
jgi:hypothetical protein